MVELKKEVDMTLSANDEWLDTDDYVKEELIYLFHNILTTMLNVL